MAITMRGKYCGWRKKLTYALALILIFMTSALGQSSRGSIHGRILDDTGAAIPGAQITATGARQVSRSTKSEADGAYAFNGLAPGNYIVQVTYPGFVQREPVQLGVNGNPAAANIIMRLAVSSESVTVHEDLAPAITTDPDANASATTVKQEGLRALSDDPDDLESDIRALAGPSAGLNAANIYIDGVQAGDAVLPGKAAISEVRINQNPFAPEFDDMGLGRIELITKSSSDKYKGEAHFNYGNDIFNSRNPYAAEKPPFDLKQYGGSLTGPINRRAAFFFDVDRRLVGNGAVINAAILDPATLAIINPYTQTFVSPFVRTRLGPRLDLQLGPKHSLTVRYGLTQNDNQHSGVGNFTLISQGANIHLREHALQVTETSTLGANIVNQTQFQFLHQYQTHQATDPAPTIDVLNAFNGGGDPSTFSSYIHHHFQAQSYTTIAAHSHTWKFGVRLRAISIISVSQENFLGTYTFGGAYAPVLGGNNLPLVPGIVCNPNLPAVAGCTTISSLEQYRRTLLFQQMNESPAQLRVLGGGASQFSLNAGIPLVRVGGVDAGLFVGDDWRLRPNLTVSFGLRFETQANIHDHADFAPRVGFAWSPAGGRKSAAPKLVIRGGFGIFYQRFLELDLVAAQRYNGIDQQQYLVTNPDFFPSIPNPTGLLSAQNQIIDVVSSTMRAPYLLQSMLSVERQFARRTTLALTYVNTHGLHQFRQRDINAPLPGTYTGVQGSGVLPFPQRGPIYEMESAGLFNQHQMILNVNTQARKNLSLFGSYTLNYARSNTDGLSTFPANQYSMAGEYGPAINDIRHRVSVGGSIVSLWKLEINPLIILESGIPFNITTGQDIYGTGVLTARPAFAMDPNKPGAIATPYGIFDPNPLSGETLVPRNYGRGPGQFAVNLRVGRTFTFGENAKTGVHGLQRLVNHRFTLTPAVSARNLLNHVNPGPVIGDINSPLFGRSNQLASGIGAFDNSANNRRLEFQLQLGF